MRVLLPLFPLGLVAFPGELLNLHIFEPRYRQLINECHTEGKTFGVVPTIDGKPMDIGTEMQLLEISEVYPDSKMDIKTKGLRAFKVNDYYSHYISKLYPGGEVEFRVEDEGIASSVLGVKVLGLASELYEAMHIDQLLPEYSATFKVYDIAHKLGLNINQEIDLLRINNETERLEYAIAHLEQFIPMVEEMEELKRRVKMNGHFKNVI